ncbi:MAG: leucine-rich repeat protein, partial [Lachnospiraceae bacterium]|nr:leucine-rich repeat protein [Lachnospiraceae bacterium]
MAIVIAAIPVENLGTMRAAANSKQLTDNDYTEYAYGKPELDFGADEPITNGLQLTKESNDYQGQQVKTYIFTGGILVEKLLVIPKADGEKVGIVSGIADGADNNVVINSEEYLDYVVIDEAYMNAVVEALKSEKYKASTTGVQRTNDLPTNLSSISTTKSLVTQRLTIDQFQIDTISNPVTLNYTSNNNRYTTIIPSSGTDEDIQNILKEQAKYNDWAADIDEYNQKMQDLQSKIDDFMKKYDVTTPDTGAATTEWTALVDEMNAIQNPGNIELSFEDLCKGVGGITDNKSSFLHKTICDRAVDGNVTLKGASLIEAGDGKFIIRMLPDSVSSEQITDASNHLITGKIKVEGIRNDAFKGNRDITSVSIPNTVKFIGARAFYKCTGLATVTFADGSNLEKIGAEAFLNANVSNIHFPVALKQIGVGAFAKSALVTAEFDDKAEGNPIVIWPYAFFGCEQLANVEFPTYEVNAKTNFVIGKGAFAVDSRSNGGAMTTFTFPEQIVDIISTNNTYATDFGLAHNANNTTGVEKNEDAYDYILSGRNRLEKVTFPIELGDTKIPDNTFIGCFGLTNVIFPESADAAYYTPTELFKSVEHANGLVVDGPANKRGAANNPASPRISTRKAVDVDGEPVLYRFFIDGKEYYETGDGE